MKSCCSATILVQIGEIMLRFTPLVALLLLATGTREAAAQRRVPTQPAQEVTQLNITARLGAKSYTAVASGTCKHEPSASIYDVPAALYMVEAQGGEGSQIKQLNLTLWRPKNGSADQISLSLDAGSSSTRIDVNPRGPAVGSGSVQLQQVGSGGKFELKGKDAKGTPLSLTITCPSFAAVEAAGG
jgi:hypothetical protein